MIRLFKRRRGPAAPDDPPAAAGTPHGSTGAPGDAGGPAERPVQPAPPAPPHTSAAPGEPADGTADASAPPPAPSAADASPGGPAGAAPGPAAAPPSDAPPPAPPAGTPPGAPADADRPPPRGIALDEIARGMQHAAAAANQLLAHQYTAMLDQFFDERDDGLLAPREVQVALDAEHTMPVPLVALATPRGLALERMVVHLTVRGDFTEALPAGGLAGDDQRGRFYVTLAPRSSRKDAQGNPGQRDTEHIDIEMQFAALAPPEAIMRVIDEYTHRLVPRARHGNEEHHDGEPA
ncbi:DUF2589 domain-containing protein [Burkholderia stagnalis]|uniref:DUF2589 domain-containing protein n=9 Tax=Burkholderia stagnalis TaxID=1503054 RepID=UPI000AE85884|nr:DUF2589 domain-containing protein [Burkholderia stagnalis]